MPVSFSAVGAVLFQSLMSLKKSISNLTSDIFYSLYEAAMKNLK